MSVPAVALTYVDLAEVRRLAGFGVEPARDAVLARIAAGVTATISDVRSGLGVAWDRLAPVPATRSIEVLNGTAYFPVPAIAVLDVAIGVEPFPTFSPALASPDHGWFRAVVLNGYGGLITQTATVTAVWADRPGGDPPDAVVTFANWATAQLWRRQSAGHSGQINPEGYTVITDDPWKSTDWKNLQRAYRVPRTGAV